LIDDSRYGAVVVAAAFTLMFVGFGAAYSFAAFFAAFETEFGASRGDIALVFSLCAFLWFSSGAPAGMLADRFGARRVALAGVACLVLALWAASVAQSLAMLYAIYSIGIGVGVGADLRAVGRRGATLVQRQPRVRLGPRGRPASAPAISPGRCSPRGGSGSSAGAALI
jgi:MFS family permease